MTHEIGYDAMKILKSCSVKYRITVALIIFTVGLVIIFLAGPRVDIDQTIQVPTLPDSLDQFLVEQENQFNDNGKLKIQAKAVIGPLNIPPQPCCP